MSSYDKFLLYALVFGEFSEIDIVIALLDEYICNLKSNHYDYKSLVWDFRTLLYNRRSQLSKIRSDIKSNKFEV